MSEATLITSLVLLGFTAIVIVLLDRFVGRITSPDPEHEDWPQ